MSDPIVKVTWLCPHCLTEYEDEQDAIACSNTPIVLVALGFLEFSSENPGSGCRIIRPMSVDESFTAYFEEEIDGQP